MTKTLRVTSALIFVAVLSIVAAAQTRSDSDFILAAEKAWADAPVRHDYETFAKYMSEDYVLIVVNTEPGKKPAFEFSTKAQWVERVYLWPYSGSRPIDFRKLFPQGISRPALWISAGWGMGCRGRGPWK